MTIKSINYNWFFVSNDGNDSGTGFDNRTLGAEYGGVKVTEIVEHGAMGEGDKWFYDVHYSDGTKQRIFNPNEVFYE